MKTDNFYANKIFAVNSFAAIKAALIENLTPVLVAAKFKNDGSFDKRTKEKIDLVLDSIRANYTEHGFRIWCKPSINIPHIWVTCDFWVVTGPGNRGQYVEQSFLFDQEKGSFDPAMPKLISPAAVKAAELRHKELEKLISELESEKNGLRFNYRLNNFGDFL